MHNTPEANEAFKRAWDATNARYRAAIAQDTRELPQASDLTPTTTTPQEQQ